MNVTDIATREDSANWLMERGYYARPRDWVMGETVYILASEQFPSGPNGLRLWKHCVCIHEVENSWAVSDMAPQHHEPICCGQLSAATQKAHELLVAKISTAQDDEGPTNASS